MRTLSLLLSLFIFAASARAQDKDTNTITIHSSSTVQIPADRLAFHITINAEANTPRQAYRLHKQREQVLIRLLKQHEIKEENINFEPITISQHYIGRDQEKSRIQTRQSVTLTLTDFKKYEDIQITLIQNGFDEFSGQFKSSKSEQGKDQALKQALQTARGKAELIARQTGIQLTGVSSVNFSYSQAPPRPMMEYAMAKTSDSSMVTEYDQSVSVSAQVSVEYSFSRK